MKCINGRSRNKWVAILVFFMLIFSQFSFVWNTQASSNVPTDWLLLELPFDGNSQDTSGRNKKIIENNISFQWKTNTSPWNVYFPGDSWLQTNLGWSAGIYGQYTVNFWLKGEPETNIEKVIFSSDKWDILSVYHYSNNINKCKFITSQFDCNTLFDNEWHNVIIRKKGSYNKVFIDGQKVYDKKEAKGAIGYNIGIGGSINGNEKNQNLQTSYSVENARQYGWRYQKYYNKWEFHYPFNGNSISHFRFYDRALNESELTDLITELNYLKFARSTKVETYKDVLFAKPVAHNSVLWKNNYTIKFSVQTPASGRNNSANGGSGRGLNNVQTLFSTNTSNQKDKLNITLSKEYTCGTPLGNFDCSILRDEKIHEFLVHNESNNLKIYLDKELKFEKSGVSLPTWNQLTMQNSPVWIDSKNYYQNYMWESYSCTKWFSQNSYWVCQNKSQFSWTIYSFTVYDRAIPEIQMNDILWSSSTSLDSLSNLIATLRANIEKYDNNTLNVRISGVIEQAKKDQTSYYYSYDQKEFQQIATGSLIEDGNNYKVAFDVSDIWYGDKNLYLYIQDTKETFFAKLNFAREKLTFDMNIEQPDSTSASNKTIRASYPDWELLMSVTHGEVCNDSMSFESYSDLTFTSPSDNGKRICYKGIDTTTKKEFYQISAPIRGIESQEEQAGADIFAGFMGWSYSKDIKTNDTTYLMLGMFSIDERYKKGSAFVDVNGDGLVDVLYRDNNGPYGLSVQKRIIMVNKGDYSFNIPYKCVQVINDSKNEVKKGFYGNCADID